MIARALPRHATADHASRLAATVALAFAALLMLLPLLAVSAATAPWVERRQSPDDRARPRRLGWSRRLGQVVAGLQKDGYPTSTPALGLQSTVRGCRDRPQCP